MISMWRGRPLHFEIADHAVYPGGKLTLVGKPAPSRRQTQIEILLGNSFRQLGQPFAFGCPVVAKHHVHPAVANWIPSSGPMGLLLLPLRLPGT